MDIELLSPLFFVIALVYSTVGFGGGSSYIALLFLSSISYLAIPSIALTCNLIVVAGGAYHYTKNGHLKWKLLLPFIVTSIPFAYIGGSIKLSKETFQLLLGLSLLFASLRMIFKKKNNEYSNYKIPSIIPSALVGSFLGLLSGLIGIGGGIFLSPILFNFKWGKPKQIAAVCTLFILVNSLSGLMGQIQKSNSFDYLISSWPLLLSVFLGGQIGSYFGANNIKPRFIEVTTAVLVLFVSSRILFQ